MDRRLPQSNPRPAYKAQPNQPFTHTQDHPYSGKIICPLIVKFPVTAGAPVSGWPPPIVIVYDPSAIIGSPAPLTILKSRSFSSNRTFSVAPASRCTRLNPRSARSGAPLTPGND